MVIQQETQMDNSQNTAMATKARDSYSHETRSSVQCEMTKAYMNTLEKNVDLKHYTAPRIALLLPILFILLLNAYGPSTAASSAGSVAGSISNRSDEDSDVTVEKSNDSFYDYEPYVTATGSDYLDIASNRELMLTNFTIAMWFRTTMDVPYKSESFIVNKGGIGSDSRGTNLNYGMWLRDSETIAAGFEDSFGAIYSVQSTNAPAAYVLYEWHYAMATYDGSKLALYIDGVLVASKLLSDVQPDKLSNQPVRVGANSLILNGFFIGDIDEIRIWNRGLTNSEASAAYRGQFNSTGQVLHLGF